MGTFRKSLEIKKKSKQIEKNLKNLDEELKKTGALDDFKSIDIDAEDNNCKKFDWRSEVFTEEESINISEELESLYETVKKKRELRQLQKVDEHLSNIDANFYKLRDELIENINREMFPNIPALEKKLDEILTVYGKLNKKISEGFLNEPTGSPQGGDPLAKTDFVTFDQLKQHYTLFLDRISTQLATLGGGGETQLMYLDDVVGIATNPSVYDGKYLKYDHATRKFVFSDVGSIGITLEDLSVTVSSPGISTLTYDNTTGVFNYTPPNLIGYATTESITNIGAGVTVTNVLYVTTDGIDTNTGRRLGEAKRTIGAALTAASTGTVIKVSAGSYIENNPLVVPEQVSIIGDSLREVSVQPQNANLDLFYVTNGNYIAEMSYTGTLNPGKAIFAFNPVGAGTITQSPYIQNCTNFIPNSIGMKINGNHADGNLKSMVLDSYTQYNQGGIGVSITNEGYAQLVSLFTICNDIAVYCGSGGACDLTNSNSSFGNYGLVADGVGSQQFVGITTVASFANTSEFVIAGLGNTRPYDGQVVYIDDLYNTVGSISVSAGGTGYTSTPTVTISAPTTSWGVQATAVAIVKNGGVSSIEIISNGRGYETVPTITISPPDVGINTATATLSLIPTYYTIQSSTPVSSGIATITLTDNIPYDVGIGTTVTFFKQSRILASGHSFEYIGSGVTIANALPAAGGVPIQANETDSRNGGLVVYTSTDQSGNFRIGDGVTINQQTGTISGTSYTKSLFSTMTPFILALGGD